MKLYEITLLISPELNEGELEKLCQKVKSLIEEEKGTVEKTEQPSRRRLGISIKKKDTAFMAVIIFKLEPQSLAGFEKKLQTENDILRYSILTKPAKKLGRNKRRRKPMAAKEIKPDLEAKKIGSVEKTTAEKPKKVELENIGKKLDEILKEE